MNWFAVFDEWLQLWRRIERRREVVICHEAPPKALPPQTKYAAIWFRCFSLRIAMNASGGSSALQSPPGTPAAQACIELIGDAAPRTIRMVPTDPTRIAALTTRGYADLMRRCGWRFLGTH